jgi:ubiquitin-like 1-activating enzyme E1 B
MTRATLNDLVEDFVRLGLGYGDKEFIVSSEVGILYDVDETENLNKKLTDLGMYFLFSPFYSLWRELLV